ncbi:MAG: PTS transporter subunit EIIB, partial [Clostridium celatum]|nr:PTS transporter subunit EIIB [Clostridium celatum]
MSKTIRDYEKLAVDIIEAVGGKNNIIKASRCATRLRLVLKETTNEAKEKVSGLTGVITVVENGGQFQVVIGTHVGKVFDKVASELNLDSNAIEEDAPKASVLNRIIA